MKKARIGEIILAIIFIAAAASGAIVSYSNSNCNIQPKECFIFDISVVMVKGTEVVDEQGSKHVHLDFVPRRFRKVMYFTKSGRFMQCWEAKTSDGKSLAGQGATHQAVMVMNAWEGSTDGYMAVSIGLPSLDSTTPTVRAYLSGEIKTEWNEEEQRYVLINGSGVVCGSSNPTHWDAWADLKPASPSTQSAMTPVWGNFTVRRAVLMDKEIVDLIK